MPFELEKTFSRLWSINDGNMMVVTDLHGDWDAYWRYRDRFLDLHARGKADGLIFTGDLIHPDSDEEPDHSLDIVLNVLDLKQRYGDAIIYLCGNHELPHIYGYGLSKGSREYTPAFEAALSKSGKRREVMSFLYSLPFFIRTRTGVSMSHAGAAPGIPNFQEAKILFEWEHDKQIAEARSRLAEAGIETIRRAYAKLSQAGSYDQLARHYLAVTGSDDPRYDDLLVGLFVTSHPDYQRLHSALFTKCEAEYGVYAYSKALTNMLQTLSVDYWTQKVLVAGHMRVRNGHQIVLDRHLRLASGCHATPREAGQYLLFNARQPTENVADLEKCLYDIRRFS